MIAMMATLATLTFASRRLEMIRENVEQGRCCSPSEVEAIAALGGPMAETYGEITLDGMKALANRVMMGPSDIFADLGSGCGRAVFQALTDFDVASTCGIELAESRHELALQSLAALPAEQASRVRLLCGDCAAADAWQPGGALADATIVYVASLCFGDELMQRLGARLEESARVRTVATLKPFAGGLGGGFVAVDPPEACEMSWTALRPNEHGDGDTTQPVYLYARYTDSFDLRTLVGDWALGSDHTLL